MPFGPDDLSRAIRDQRLPDPTPVKPSTPPAPDNSVGPWPYLALAAGKGLDAYSSIHNFDRGYREENPMYAWMGPQPRLGIAAMSGLQTALMSYAMHHQAETGHPTAAKVLGYLGGATGAAPGIYNLTRPDLKK